MFKKILIANRGEIACRIIKTAKKMGIQTVAIYSSADKESLHVSEADSAFWVGESLAAMSYLNIPAIIAVAKKSGAEAIHPGYGFLAENVAFANATIDAGLNFIGPSIKSMQIMASKQLAKQFLQKINIPLTPGYHGVLQSDTQLFKEACLIGFPILLKAALGGGGKGMRVVDNVDNFHQCCVAARREALACFADDTLIIEKLIESPRHIEVQIMADNFGQVLHLFERDCSIQRRHQKVIEEARADTLTKALCNELLAKSCEVARAIEYRGVGTVEFLVEPKGKFYFMEMNTRLQVEHPVTEMITGLDLVAWQIKIAANEHLPAQESVTAFGHAIECRIYAEDPAHDFTPSVGLLEILKEPNIDGIRIDSGVKGSAFMTPYYDSMIAKLIAHGANRAEALQRMQLALNDYFIIGVKTNIEFLQKICKHPRFLEGGLSTNFLCEESINLDSDYNESLLQVAASYDYLTLVNNVVDPIFKSSFAWQMHSQSYWYWHYLINNVRFTVKITPSNAGFLLSIQCPQERSFELTPAFMQERLVIDNGSQIFSVTVANKAKILYIHLEGVVRTVERFNCKYESSSVDKAGYDEKLVAPMPGTIIALMKKVGDKVSKGEPLLVLEAMKIEHTIYAPQDGVVLDFFYELGAQVNEGVILLAMEPLSKLH